MSRIHAVLLPLALVGCSGKSPETHGPGGPTWYGDVEPLVRENCVSCHQAGGIGAMRLDDYATAKTWAPVMADDVQSRKMPPWLENEDGSCQTFRHSRWLDDEAIATIVDWAAAGAPEGDPADAVTDPLPSAPALDRVDASVSTPTFLPQVVGEAYAENDEYRCFRVGNPNDTDQFLTGYEVVPGNQAIVHHVLMMPVDPAASAYTGETNAEAMDRIDGADGRDGWPCFGAAGEDVSAKSTPVVWAPGMGAVEYPDLGIPLLATDELVVQIHFNLADPANVGASDQTRIDLRTEDHVDRIGYLALPDAFLNSLFYGNPETIPPGEASYAYSFALSGTELLQYAGAPVSSWHHGFQLAGVMPHMHQLGHQQQVTLEHDGEEQCLSDVQNWDFHWQLTYFYEDAVHIQPDDSVAITCDWDSTSATGPTLPGWGTQNEMCLATMLVVPD